MLFNYFNLIIIINPGKKSITYFYFYYLFYTTKQNRSNRSTHKNKREKTGEEKKRQTELTVTENK